MLVLTLGLLATLGLDALEAQRDVETHERGARQMLAVTDFGIGLGALLVERQTANVVLSGPLPATAAQRADITRSREHAAPLERSGAIVASLPPSDARARAIATLLAELPGLRAQADRLAGLALEARPPAELRHYLDEARRLTEAAAAAWLQLLPHAAGGQAALMTRAGAPAVSPPPPGASGTWCG